MTNNRSQGSGAAAAANDSERIERLQREIEAEKRATAERFEAFQEMLRAQLGEINSLLTKVTCELNEKTERNQAEIKGLRTMVRREVEGEEPFLAPLHPAEASLGSRFSGEQILAMEMLEQLEIISSHLNVCERLERPTDVEQRDLAAIGF